MASKLDPLPASSFDFNESIVFRARQFMSAVNHRRFSSMGSRVPEIIGEFRELREQERVYSRQFEPNANFRTWNLVSGHFGCISGSETTARHQRTYSMRRADLHFFSMSSPWAPGVVIRVHVRTSSDWSREDL